MPVRKSGTLVSAALCSIPLLAVAVHTVVVPNPPEDEQGKQESDDAHNDAEPSASFPESDKRPVPSVDEEDENGTGRQCNQHQPDSAEQFMEDHECLPGELGQPLELYCFRREHR